MKRTLELKSLVQDVNAGLTDEEIMSKYNLSEDALRKVFDKLMRALAACSKGNIEVDD